MKINEITAVLEEEKEVLGEGRKPKKDKKKKTAKKSHKKSAKKKADDVEDLDSDGTPEDPEQDKTPHILMQLRKALDVDGDYPISFKDGKKTKLSMDKIRSFIHKYMDAKPEEKEAMQNKAISSLESFEEVLKAKTKKSPVDKIKGNRYMSHFGGDLDDK
jgi:hypothetical protein